MVLVRRLWADDPAHVGKSIQAFWSRGLFGLFHSGPACQGSGCLDIGNIIERGQRVQGTVGALDAHRAGLSEKRVSKNMVGAMMRRQKVYRLASVAFKRGSSIVYFSAPKSGFPLPDALQADNQAEQVGLPGAGQEDRPPTGPDRGSSRKVVGSVLRVP